MQELQQLLYLKQFLGGGGQGWLLFGFLLCLFAVLLFRPERIRSAGLFGWACARFALSVIAPPVLTYCYGYLQNIEGTSSRPGGGAMSLWLPVQQLAGPLLFGLSLIFGLLALMPRSAPQSRPGPTKHPLE